MCGIVGIVKLNPQAAVDEVGLKRMRDVLRHRGPDGEGLWIEGPVGLGMRRLAIVDVTGGHQPMANEDGTVWIVYNGEIYNHADLRRGLERRGHAYRTRSDTETILHLYEEEGASCVERLQGMFAFALWDRLQGRLLLARDRLGIKPLYYAYTDKELLFASEIKALLVGGSVRPALNEAIVPEFLATGFVAGEETFFKGVRKLLPGRTLSWTLAEGSRERRYWRLPAATEEAPVTLAERAGELRTRLTAAVRSHLMSDVPLGLFLSGRIDSSGLARAAWARLLGFGPSGCSRPGRSAHAESPQPDAPLCPAHGSGTRARAPRAVLRKLRRVPHGPPVLPPGGPQAARRSRPLRRGAALLRGVRQRYPRTDEPRRPPDVFGRAVDETGSDEHGGLDRKPGPVPRPRVRRIRDGDPWPFQAARLAHQGRLAGRAAGPGAA